MSDHSCLGLVGNLVVNILFIHPACHSPFSGLYNKFVLIKDFRIVRLVGLTIPCS